MEDNAKFEEWKERFARTSLQISRIPEQYKTEFLEIANKEFCGDYGMFLRELIRTWKGIYTESNEELRIRTEALEEEIEKLNKKIDDYLKEIKRPDVIEKRMADGHIVKIEKVKRNEQNL